MSSDEEIRNRLSLIGLNNDKINDTIKNESLTKLLLEMIDILMNELNSINNNNDNNNIDRIMGKLIYQLATTSKSQIRQYFPLIIKYIANKKLDNESKLSSSIEYLLTNPTETTFNIDDFEKNSGINVIITDEIITNTIKNEIEKNLNELNEKRYRFNIGIIINEVKKTLKFIDSKLIKLETDKQIEKLLGPKTEKDLAKPKKEKQIKSITNNNNETNNKIQDTKEEECRDIIELLRRINFHKIGENYKTDNYVITSNTMKLLAEHKKIVNGRVRTRFPPEPNGILHIGHAKAININFGYAQAYNGDCILRYDDTNPEKEEERFVHSIRDMIEWLGYRPYRITYSSDYFDELYELAIKLIKNNLAYVCHQKPEELKGFNPAPSPWRNRSIDENLKLFEAMKMGKMNEGEATLRMKYTMEEGKIDPVAYRIKMCEHHRTGNKWCIYPTYDFTHCLVDSIENITHSLCTKEFQNRRSSYYWLCNSLDVYCPVQWEYGRLNVYYTVVSKRKIAKLIDEGIVDDWDDPRLFTLTALRRRGYPPEAIKMFCAQMGLTGANTSVDPAMLEASVRDVLNTTAKRCMAVLQPLRVIIVNMPIKSSPTYLEVPDFPADPNSSKHRIPFDCEIYIEYDDFRSNDDDRNFRRLTPKQLVGLRYANCAIRLKNIHYQTNANSNDNNEQKIDFIEVEYEPIDQLKEKPRAFIHWVSHPLRIEVRLYDRLFSHKNPEDPNEVPDGFLSDCNRNAKTIIPSALVDISVKYAKVYQQFQFERIGFFSVDTDSSVGRLVFNRTVSLKESSTKT